MPSPIGQFTHIIPVATSISEGETEARGRHHTQGRPARARPPAGTYICSEGLLEPLQDGDEVQDRPGRTWVAGTPSQEGKGRYWGLLPKTLRRNPGKRDSGGNNGVLAMMGDRGMELKNRNRKCKGGR